MMTLASSAAFSGFAPSWGDVSVDSCWSLRVFGALFGVAWSISHATSADEVTLTGEEQTGRRLYFYRRNDNRLSWHECHHGAVRW